MADAEKPGTTARAFTLAAADDASGLTYERRIEVRMAALTVASRSQRSGDNTDQKIMAASQYEAWLLGLSAQGLEALNAPPAPQTQEG